MIRILIIITRMYAARGDPRDEFVEVWHGGVNTDYRIFTCQTGERRDHVLVIHGYEYPQNVERAVERARASIETALKGTGLTGQLPGARAGVVFHPRQSWAPNALRRIADGLTATLREYKAFIEFVEPYHHGSEFERKLVLACLERRDWASELDRLWPFFLEPEMARYTQRFGTLVHNLQSLITPIREDLNTWRRYGLNDDTGRQILREREGLALTALDRARSLVLDESEDTQSIAKLTWEVADRLEEARKERVIAHLAELEKLFAQGDPRYNKAEQLLRVFSPRFEEQKTTDDDRLAMLRAHLMETNALDTWAVALSRVLDNLCQVWAK